ncbi:hypothetical protein [Streptomyces longwoodensis]|uniref:hypothetical protein n=1 Tax=Streptomyces longwoodensis TaxID=68231 RepID=UPI0033ECA7FD
MADSGSAGAGAGDGGDGGDAAVVAYWEALHDFADRLNAFHIFCGAPSYRDIAKASREPKLSQADITEFLPTALPNRYAVRNELYALRNDAVAGASGHFGIGADGDRTRTRTRTRTDMVTTVYRLGQALPKPTG